jgi:hypothetical protein
MYLRASACLLAVSVLVACGSSGRALAPSLTSGNGGSGGAGGNGGSGTGGTGLGFGAAPSGPPSADAGGLCGNQIHPITTQPPNVYFIFDISGSMSTPVVGGTRYSVVQAAAAELVGTLRYVIRAGAAAFPLDVTATASCHPGGEVYPPTLDDPLGFNDATQPLVPYGGTPTAATVLALVPKLQALPGKTIAVLATDGAPNCDAAATCTAAECTENIEGCAPEDTCCAMSTNCCAPNGPAGPLSCVDHDATVAAVAGLHAAGVDVSIVGIPGSKPYAAVLADMAFAGGVPQSAAPYYYDVEDLSTLGTILRAIATAGISCDITIGDPPSTQDETNVYLDQQVVLSDPTNGWTWTAADVITLHGAACAELKSGSVAQVQVVSGCPTQATK